MSLGEDTPSFSFLSLHGKRKSGVKTAHTLSLSLSVSLFSLSHPHRSLSLSPHTHTHTRSLSKNDENKKELSRRGRKGGASRGTTTGQKEKVARALSTFPSSPPPPPPLSPPPLPQLPPFLLVDARRRPSRRRRHGYTSSVFLVYLFPPQKIKDQSREDSSNTR